MVLRLGNYATWTRRRPGGTGLHHRGSNLAANAPRPSALSTDEWLCSCLRHNFLPTCLPTLRTALALDRLGGLWMSVLEKAMQINSLQVVSEFLGTSWDASSNPFDSARHPANTGLTSKSRPVFRFNSHACAHSSLYANLCQRLLRRCACSRRDCLDVGLVSASYCGQ